MSFIMRYSMALACCALFISVSAVPLGNEVDDPDRTLVFPDTFSANGTIMRSNKYSTFKVWVSKPMNSVRKDIDGPSHIEMRELILGNVKPFGMIVNYITCGVQTCHFLKGTQFKKVSIENYHSSPKELKLIGDEMVNGVETEKWEKLFEETRVTLNVRRNGKGFVPVRVKSLRTKNNVTVTINIDEYSSGPIPQSVFAYDLEDCTDLLSMSPRMQHNMRKRDIHQEPRPLSVEDSLMMAI